ncbi:MAG: hypothetical protein K0R49_920 [Burkholderiales bacterium]|jgi:multidrug transporter EmrE-like cation transporter|nr:hypothetical protein [Burkholderiales bacterium]
MNPVVWFFIAISSSVASSIFWKYSAREILKLSSNVNLLHKQVTSLWYIVGWFFYLLATFLWIYLLGKYDFSKIYPIFVGSCIVLSLITGLIFFKENTGMLYKTIGAVLIICGITFITKS